MRWLFREKLAARLISSTGVINNSCSMLGMRFSSLPKTTASMTANATVTVMAKLKLMRI